MKVLKLRAADTPLSTQFTACVLNGIGEPGFATGLLNAMQNILPASHCTVFALGRDGRVSAISTASVYGEAATTTAQSYVRMGFDLQDSNMVWLAKQRQPKTFSMWLSHQLADEVANEEYRKVCYGENGIRERMSILLFLEDGKRIAISFYRNLSFVPFTQADFSRLSELATFFMAAVKCHVRMVQKDAGGSDLHLQILKQLTQRERQVVSQILSGHTTKEASQALKISPTTVLTYRYRAFTKLGIRTQRELLAMLDKFHDR